MLKLYCQKCGGLNAYVSEKPNFCQKCGNNFDPGLKAAIETHAAAETVDEDDEADVTLNFNLQALDVEIESGNTGTEVIGNIAGQLTGEGLEGDVIPEGVDTSYTEEDFKREAGSTRGGNEAKET